ncbi:MAG TPA: hypothetical protein VMW72_09735 [Sedimentisphaerales bacterium]|nr:hypothetical protein [Sedimentisphaerales bacterium]
MREGEYRVAKEEELAEKVLNSHVVMIFLATSWFVILLLGL